MKNFTILKITLFGYQVWVYTGYSSILEIELTDLKQQAKNTENDGIKIYALGHRPSK